MKTIETSVPATPGITSGGNEEFGFTFDAPAAVTKTGRGKASVYPLVPDPDQTLFHVGGQYKQDKEAYETAEGNMQKGRAIIIPRAEAFWYATNSGKAESEHVALATSEGELLCMFVDKYSPATSAAAVRNIVGPDILKQHFKPSFTVKIKSDALPESPATQQLLNELIALFTKHGQAAALEFKQSVLPRKGWVDVRHRALSPEQNIQLAEVCPCVCQLKIK